MDQRVVNRIGVVAVVIGLACGCAKDSPVQALEQRLNIAEQKFEQVREIGFAWRANRISIEQARIALAGGDHETTHELIEASIRLSEAALAQAELQAQEWSTRFPFDYDE